MLDGLLDAAASDKRQPPLTGNADLWHDSAMQDVETPTRIVAVKLTTVETPTHLLGWLPIVWTRVPFAGPAAAPTPLRAMPFVLILVLSGLLLYPCMSFHLFEPDEGRYAQIPREMLTSGEWIVPTLQGEPYLDKPPLFYWLVMLSYSIFGYHDWAARLIPALAMHASILLTYLLGRRIVGERSAFWGALLLTVSPIFLGVGRLLVLDGLLTLWITISVLAAYLAQSPRVRYSESLGCLDSRWWSVAALACALGVLTKGPVALVLLLIPLWTTPARCIGGDLLASVARVLQHCFDRQSSLVRRRLLAASGVHRLFSLAAQRRALRRAVRSHSARVVLSPILLFGLLPTLVLAWPVTRFFTSTQAGEIKARCPAMGYLLLAGVWCIFFFRWPAANFRPISCPRFRRCASFSAAS